jgi:hypothetical protein
VFKDSVKFILHWTAAMYRKLWKRKCIKYDIPQGIYEHLQKYQACIAQ